MSRLDRSKILSLFDALDERLGALGVVGELYVVGGAVLCLVHRARDATQDVDAMFEPKAVVREQAEQLAREHDVPENWLNDAVKGYLSGSATFEPFLELSNLRVLTASPEYLLAMKALAMRLGAEFHDEGDVRYLLRYLGVESYEEAVAIVAKYYPMDRIPQKTLYALEEILESSE